MPKYKFRRQSKRIEQPEMDALLNDMPNFMCKAILCTLYVTGARISEVLGLRIKDFVKKGNDVTITIATLKKRSTTNPVRDVRHLTFDSKKTEYLDVVLRYIKQCKKAQKDVPYTINRKTVWKYIHRSNQNISPHIFRHSRLQKLADSGANAHEIRLWAGHKNTNMASNYIEQSTQMTQKLKGMIH